MKRYLKFSGLMLFAITCIAQNYHITDFLPDSLKTWQIYGTLNANVGDLTSNSEYNLEKRDTEFSRPDARLNPGVTFQYKTITRRREWFLLYNFSPRFNKENSITESTMDQDTIWSTHSSDNYNTIQEYTFNNQFDLTEYIFGKLGVSLEGDIQMIRTFSKTKTDVTDKHGAIFYSSSDIFDQNHGNSESNNLSIELCPGISYGRIYDGNYAAKAEEILIELRRMNCLKRELSPAEFHSLAQRILNHTEKYHYDSRIQRIEALQDIIDYLSSIGAIAENAIPAILSINDIYTYAPFNFPRSFGTKFYFKTRARKYYSKSESESHSTNELWEPSVGSGKCDSCISIITTKSSTLDYPKSMLSGYSIGASYSKIKSWHFWYEAGLDFTYYYRQEDLINKQRSEKTYSYYPDTTFITESKNKSKRLYHEDDLSALINFYYQFNSRSVLRVPFRFSYIFYRYKEDSDFQTRLYETNIKITPVFTYYLTPKWSIRPSVTILLWMNRNAIEKITSQNFSCALNFTTTYYW